MISFDERCAKLQAMLDSRPDQNFVATVICEDASDSALVSIAKRDFGVNETVVPRSEVGALLALFESQCGQWVQ